MKKATTAAQRIERSKKFTNIFIANCYADRQNELHKVVLFENGTYLVCTNVDAYELVKAGYEYAN